jgi:hypothetical protein
MHGTEPKYREPEERQEVQAVRRRDLREDERRGEVLKVDQKLQEAIRRYERLALKHKALVTIASTIIHLRYKIGSDFFTEPCYRKMGSRSEAPCLNY